ncbi:MAG: NAD-dependent epimerase/dehydratase family protein [Rhizomicrobium sp.]
MKLFVAGGAGFIGSHVTRHLLADGENEVTVFDNFTSGKEWHLEPVLKNSRLRIVQGNLRDLDAVTKALAGAERVYHFASNPDIARAMVDPAIDFWEGTYLTQNLLDGMRVQGVKEIAYASGSGVYGDCGSLAVTEDHTPMLPISTYGASKLGCETLIHSYTHMFGITARVFRFANVVGPRQTHGVAYDFIRRLRDEPTRLKILGDGSQSKSYIHVEDIIAAIQYFLKRDTGRYSYYHLATDDYLTVREIADLVVEAMGLKGVAYDFTGGNRGWSGDVPIVRFDLAKVHGAGWQSKRNSREAMLDSVRAMLTEMPSAK